MDDREICKAIHTKENSKELGMYWIDFSSSGQRRDAATADGGRDMTTAVLDFPFSSSLVGLAAVVVNENF